jgi:hypothetical protein
MKAKRFVLFLPSCRPTPFRTPDADNDRRRQRYDDNHFNTPDNSSVHHRRPSGIRVPGERRVVRFAFSACSLIKKPRPAVALWRVYMERRARVAREKRQRQLRSRCAASFASLVSTVLLKHLDRAELKSKLPASILHRARVCPRAAPASARGLTD